MFDYIVVGDSSDSEDSDFSCDCLIPGYPAKSTVTSDELVCSEPLECESCIGKYAGDDMYETDIPEHLPLPDNCGFPPEMDTPKDTSASSPAPWIREHSARDCRRPRGNGRWSRKKRLNKKNVWKTPDTGVLYKNPSSQWLKSKHEILAGVLHAHGWGSPMETAINLLEKYTVSYETDVKAVKVWGVADFTTPDTCVDVSYDHRADENTFTVCKPITHLALTDKNKAGYIEISMETVDETQARELFGVDQHDFNEIACPGVKYGCYYMKKHGYMIADSGNVAENIKNNYNCVRDSTVTVQRNPLYVEFLIDGYKEEDSIVFDYTAEVAQKGGVVMEVIIKPNIKTLEYPNEMKYCKYKKINVIIDKPAPATFDIETWDETEEWVKFDTVEFDGISGVKIDVSSVSVWRIVGAKLEDFKITHYSKFAGKVTKDDLYCSYDVVFHAHKLHVVYYNKKGESYSGMRKVDRCIKKIAEKKFHMIDV